MHTEQGLARAHITKVYFRKHELVANGCAVAGLRLAGTFLRVFNFPFSPKKAV
jgi:hypothetical protein